jgi:arylsulfatase
MLSNFILEDSDDHGEPSGTQTPEGPTGNGDWADCLAQMDHNIGRLLDTIDELGSRDDTIVVFTSDNGADTSTPPWIGTTKPWSGTIFTPMEGNNRVPFIVRWPGQILADRDSNEIVHEVDTFTTLARFAGAEVPRDPPIDGVDQGDFFRGRTDCSAREGFPIFFGEKLYGAKWRNFKMLLVDQADAEAPSCRWASHGSTTCTPTRRSKLSTT